MSDLPTWAKPFKPGTPLSQWSQSVTPSSVAAWKASGGTQGSTKKSTTPSLPTTTTTTQKTGTIPTPVIEDIKKSTPTYTQYKESLAKSELRKTPTVTEYKKTLHQQKELEQGVKEGKYTKKQTPFETVYTPVVEDTPVAGVEVSMPSNAVKDLGAPMLGDIGTKRGFITPAEPTELGEPQFYLPDYNINETPLQAIKSFSAGIGSEKGTPSQQFIAGGINAMSDTFTMPAEIIGLTFQKVKEARELPAFATRQATTGSLTGDVVYSPRLEAFVSGVSERVLTKTSESVTNIPKMIVERPYYVAGMVATTVAIPSFDVAPKLYSRIKSFIKPDVTIDYVVDLSKIKTSTGSLVSQKLEHAEAFKYGKTRVSLYSTPTSVPGYDIGPQYRGWVSNEQFNAVINAPVKKVIIPHKPTIKAITSIERIRVNEGIGITPGESNIDIPITRGKLTFTKTDYMDTISTKDLNSLMATGTYKESTKGITFAGTSSEYKIRTGIILEENLLPKSDYYNVLVRSAQMKKAIQVDIPELRFTAYNKITKEMLMPQVSTNDFTPTILKSSGQGSEYAKNMPPVANVETIKPVSPAASGRANLFMDETARLADKASYFDMFTGRPLKNSATQISPVPTPSGITSGAFTTEYGIRIPKEDMILTFIPTPSSMKTPVLTAEKITPSGNMLITNSLANTQSDIQRQVERDISITIPRRLMDIRQRTMQRMDLKMDTEQAITNEIDISTRQLFDQETKQITRQRQISKTDYAPIPKHISMGFGGMPPGISFPLPRIETTKRAFNIPKLKQRSGYSPSFTSLALGIRGPRPPKGTWGVALRPLPQKTSKKKKRVNAFGMGNKRMLGV